MERGDVYLVRMALPNRQNPGGPPVLRDKYVVILRGGPRTAADTDVPVIVASSDRRTEGQRLRNFEVNVDANDGFRHSTILDCRWPITLTKQQVGVGQYRFRLSGQRMQQVSVALVDGLQMYPPQPVAATTPPS